MSRETEKFPVIREAVASFTDREHVRGAAGALLAAGFAPSDLSVLAQHESLDIAGDIPGYPRERHPWLPAGLSDEMKWIGPLTIAGIIFLSGGPVAAALAGILGAGLGGVALKELLDRYTATGHSEDFAAALEAGAVLLWVRCEDADRELRATRILEAAGGRYVHVHGRPAGKH